MRKAAPVKERLAEKKKTDPFTTQAQQGQSCPSQPDTPPAICQQNRENLTYGAGRVNGSPHPPAGSAARPTPRRHHPPKPPVSPQDRPSPPALHRRSRYRVPGSRCLSNSRKIAGSSEAWLSASSIAFRCFAYRSAACRAVSILAVLRTPCRSPRSAAISATRAAI
mgnify:CR=1 FL=1